MRPWNILIADDHAVMRAGLRLLLEQQSDLRVVAECGCHREVLTWLATHPGGADVVTLDLTMPGGSPAALIEDVVRGSPGTRVVVLTMHDDPSYARMAFAAGASGYVMKSAADVELVSAIRTAASGGIHSTVSITPQGTVSRPPAPRLPGVPAADSLSEREREVMGMVAQGFTNQQVADRLFLSVKTVESYRARLMRKLGLKGRAELTQFAIQTGLLQQPEA